MGRPTSFILSSVLVLAGCGIGVAGVLGWQNADRFLAPPLTKACEAAIKQHLRSPSGYHRVSVSSSEKTLTLDDYKQAALQQLRNAPTDAAYQQGYAQLEKELNVMRFAKQTPVVHSLDIEYDAPNAYGAIVRGRTHCSYTAYSGAGADLSAVQSFQVKLVD